VLVVVVVLVGGLSTTLWIGAANFPDLRRSVFSVAAFASLLLCVPLTAVNVLTRWFRWHFLIRRFTPTLVTRDSLAVYLATLPAIVTPFFVGELVRVLLIRKRFRAPASYLVRIWVGERFLDFSVLLSALLCVLSPLWGGAAALVLAAIAWIVFRTGLGRESASTVSWVTALAIAITAFAWSLPILALWLTLQILASPIGFGAAVRTFAQGTLFGGVSGLPLGVFVTGSTMIGELLRAGVPAQSSVLAILVYRAGTVGFAILLGLAAMVVFRARLVRLVRGETDAHFDEIADEYEGEIPAHVRERLLVKKIDIMAGTLAAHRIPPPGRGLDLGCGQGWYLAEMQVRGYPTDGTDYSTGQLQRVRANLAEHARGRTLLVKADAQALPFADDSYDFVYGINAIHHILSIDAQQRALGEILRVLRPGGVFLLHEINTNNPVFRWYMGYLFPLLKKIDEGNERWVLPTALPPVPGARWSTDVHYFTFLPDFVPARILAWFANLERALEQSSFRRFSAHYQACLVKDATSAGHPQRDGSE
jgi:SAM-dependent methyltransferase